MEVQRQSTATIAKTTVTTNRTTERKFSVTLLRVIELFRGIKVPQTEPIELPESKPTTSQQQHTRLLLVNGHRALPLGNACHVLPSMPIPNTSHETWQNSVREGLISEIRQHFRSQICQPEFMMVSDASGAVGPCIVLSVWDESCCGSDDGKKKTVRRATKTIRMFQSMQGCPFPFKVTADRTLFAARHLRLEGGNTLAVSASLDHERSLVSLKILVGTSNQRIFRLGGLIQAGTTIYGLTVAHPIYHHPGQYEAPSDVDNTSEDSSSFETDDDSSETAEPLFKSHHFTFVGTLELGQNHDISAPNEAHNSDHVLNTDLDTAVVDVAPVKQGFQPVGRLVAVSDDHSMSQHNHHCDWALIELDSDVTLLPNLYQPKLDQPAIYIDGFHKHEISPKTEVFILTQEQKSMHGITGQSNVPLSIDGVDLLVTQIMVAKPLTPGYSGCWVVKDNLLVGCIVAVRMTLPMVYMVLAASVFQEVSDYLDEPNVGVANIDPTTSLPIQGSNDQHGYMKPHEITGSQNTSHRTSNSKQNHSFSTNVIQHQGCQKPLAHGRDRITEAHTIAEASDIDNCVAGLVESERTSQESLMSDYDDISVSTSPDIPVSSVWDEGTGPAVADHTHKNDQTDFLTLADRDVEATPMILKQRESADESAEHNTREESGVDSQVVMLEGIEDPGNWTSRTRWFMVTLLASQSFICTAAYSIPVTSLEEISISFSSPQWVLSSYLMGCIYGQLLLRAFSEHFGRVSIQVFSLGIFLVSNIACVLPDPGEEGTSSGLVLVMFRFFAGLGGGMPPLIGYYAISDMAFPTDRGRRAAEYLMLTSSSGLYLGPVIGVWFNIRRSGRWMFGTITIAAAVSLFVLLVWGKETHTPILRRRKIRRTRKDSNDQLRYRAKVSTRSVLQACVTHVRAFARKNIRIFWRLISLATDPFVVVMTVCISLSQGTIYFVISTLATLMLDRHPESPWVSGLIYLSIGVGVGLGTPVYSILDTKYFNDQRLLILRSYSKPEYRLIVMGLASLGVLSTGLLLYGWTAEDKVSIAFPIVGLFLLGLGTARIHEAMSSYLVVAYSSDASFIITVVDMCGDLLAFGSPLIAPHMIQRFGNGMSSTILALLTLWLGCVVCPVSYYFGAKHRERRQRRVRADSEYSSLPGMDPEADTFLAHIAEGDNDDDRIELVSRR